jgi:hypothetical protein
MPRRHAIEPRCGIEDQRADGVAAALVACAGDTVEGVSLLPAETEHHLVLSRAIWRRRGGMGIHGPHDGTMDTHAPPPRDTLSLVASRALILSFEGPPDLVRPDRCDVRPLLEVLLRFVQLLEKVGAHEAVDTDEPPFAVVMKELRSGSIKNVLGFVPRRPTADGALAAQRAGLDAARVAPKYLERRDVGPYGVRATSRKLAVALSRLPSTVTAHLRGSVNASLSQLAAAEPVATTLSVESFRAKILRAGGLAPRVQLKVSGFDRPITLDAPEHLAKLAGQTLYAEADVTAKIERASDDRVLHGVLSDLRILEEGDPVAAFDRWYEKAGRPWAKVKDIERGLGRGDR